MLQTGEIIRKKRIRRIYLFLLLLFIIGGTGVGQRIYASDQTKSLAEQNSKQVKTIEISTKELKQIIIELIQWKKADTGVSAADDLLNSTFLNNAGSTAGDWYPIALGRLGYADKYDAYLSVIKRNVAKRYEEEEKLDATKATEWHRIALAILAMGGDPTQLEDEEGNTINLIADGVYNRGYVKSIGAQGINGYIWGLIAVDALQYSIPEDAYYQREDLIQTIVLCQQTDGGFTLDGKTGNTDVDITAMVIQALAPYYTMDIEYKQKNNVNKILVKDVIDQALLCLSNLQKPSGDFASWGTENVESTAQVLQALCAMQINYATDERFIKNGNTVLDGILKYHQLDGGYLHSFQYDEDNDQADPKKSNSMAGEQVLCALTALLRYKEGCRRFYDFLPESKENEGKLFGNQQAERQTGLITEEDLYAFNQLPSEVTTEDYVEVVRLLDQYELASNKQEYERMGENLEERLEQIQRIQERITSINEYIMQELYPYDEVRLTKWNKVTEIIQEIKTLSEYDQQQISGLDDVYRVQAMLKGKVRELVIRFAIGIGIGIAVFLLFYNNRKRKKRKQAQKIGYYQSFDVDNDRDDDEECIEYQDEESNL